MPKHVQAVLQALLVTFIWSMSWVLMKIGLEDIPPVLFAGLRYCGAFLVLGVYAIRQRTTLFVEAGKLSRRDWLWLGLYGLVFYTATQGFQFIALSDLPSATLSLMLNFTTIMIAFLGIVLIAEYPTLVQWGGIVIFIGGVLVYFYPIDIPEAQIIGLAFGFLAMTSNSFSSILGRFINRQSRIPVLLVTLVSMGLGSLVLLFVGVALDGFPVLSATNWLIVAVLAIVNTAFAFTLWNYTLRTLSSVESSLINNTMLAQIAILAWVFLGESLSGQQIIGLVIAMVGALVVQLWARRKDVKVDAELSPTSTTLSPAPK
jgi:drug/metabolite transporter (DMT)-like permease